MLEPDVPVAAPPAKSPILPVRVEVNPDVRVVATPLENVTTAPEVKTSVWVVREVSVPERVREVVTGEEATQRVSHNHNWN